MFSRRHPYLFFMIAMTATLCSFIILLSLIFKVSGARTQFVSSEKVGVVEVTGVILDSKEIIENIKTFR